MQYEPQFASCVTPTRQRVRATFFDTDEQVVTFVQANPTMVSFFANADKLAIAAFGGTNVAKNARKTDGGDTGGSPKSGE